MTIQTLYILNDTILFSNFMTVVWSDICLFTLTSIIYLLACPKKKPKQYLILNRESRVLGLLHLNPLNLLSLLMFTYYEPKTTTTYIRNSLCVVLINRWSIFWVVRAIHRAIGSLRCKIIASPEICIARAIMWWDGATM